MAMGLLCVGTRHCDIPEVIVDGKTGFLCAEGDVVGLAETLIEIATATDRLSGLTDAGREHIERRFSMKTQLEALAGVYDRLRAAAA
jgi:colanic acid/amylovoran biosynthesis glycosyltransferase